MTVSPPNPWWARLTGTGAAMAVLAAFYVLLLASVSDKSATMDEPGHAAAGYAYWKFGDYRLDPENGNLPQRWFALPLLTGRFRYPAVESDAWRKSETTALANEWFNRMGNDTTRMLMLGRAASGLLAVILGAAVWLWSRQLFGPVGGMLSLLLYVLNPTILANGALMTSDTAGALFLFASLWCFWRMLEQVSPVRVLVSATTMGLLFVTKMSAVIIVPVALLLTVIRLVRPPASALAAPRTSPSRGSYAWSLAASAVVHAVVIVGVVWTVFGFRYSAFSDPQSEHAHFQNPWEWVLNQPTPDSLLARLHLDPTQESRAKEHLLARGARLDEWSHVAVSAFDQIRDGLLNPAQVLTFNQLRAEPPPAPAARFADFARRHHLLPEAYIYGYAHVWKLAGTRIGFLNGETRGGGWPWFFPYTFLVKTPLVVFGLVALAFAATRLRRRATAVTQVERHTRFDLGAQSTLPLWIFMIAYWVIAITSQLNIGHRHILPIYPCLFVLCGAAAGLWSGHSVEGTGPSSVIRWLRGCLAVVVLALAIETVGWFPNYLAYFNGVVRPARAYRHLVDSSLDWGQDLPALTRYLSRAPASGRVYLAYFGMGNAANYGFHGTHIYGCIGFEYAAQPPLQILMGLSPDRDRARVAEFLRREPAYDPELVPSVRFGDKSGALFLKRASELRLAPGSYFISATLLHPIAYQYAPGPWSPAHEANYQRLREIVQPLLSDDVPTRATALEKLPALSWHQALVEFNEFRFARLTAFLRHREPDDTINYSILVFRLTADDLARALDGPSP